MRRSIPFFAGTSPSHARHRSSFYIVENADPQLQAILNRRQRLEALLGWVWKVEKMILSPEQFDAVCEYDLNHRNAGGDQGHCGEVLTLPPPFNPG